MKFENPLQTGTLLKRYKRFLADVRLPSGETIVAHCANSGSMMNLCEPGSKVWLSPNTNPKAKLDWRWEMVEVDGSLVGINTSRPNRIVEEAILEDKIPELTGYDTLRREVKYGEASRIDLLLEEPGKCFVEIKSVTLKRNKEAEFPDAVTTRGAKHLKELEAMVQGGHRAVMLYLVQRMDCESCEIAKDIDPNYNIALGKALKAGVEILCYNCTLSDQGIELDNKIPFISP